MMFTRGNSDEVRKSLLRGLELAEHLDDLHSQLRLLGRLHSYGRELAISGARCCLPNGATP